jgi:hypothetical protein
VFVIDIDSLDMEAYQKVQKKKEETAENEIRVAVTG